MTATVVHKDFRTLRQAYAEVKSFIEMEVGEEVLSLDTKIEDDLRIGGDDSWELLETFVKKYQLDSTGFDCSRHFLFEGEVCGPAGSLITLLSIPLVLSYWLIKKLTFGRLDLFKPRFFPDWRRQTLDMSFGDMLTWYLTGRYYLRSDILFKLTLLQDR